MNAALSWRGSRGPAQACFSSSGPSRKPQRRCAEHPLLTLNEPTEYLDLIFYSALFITCVPLFHKGTERERESELAAMMKMTIRGDPKTAFLKLHSYSKCAQTT